MTRIWCQSFVHPVEQAPYIARPRALTGIVVVAKAIAEFLEQRF